MKFTCHMMLNRTLLGLVLMGMVGCGGAENSLDGVKLESLCGYPLKKVQFHFRRPREQVADEVTGLPLVTCRICDNRRSVSVKLLSRRFKCPDNRPLEVV